MRRGLKFDHGWIIDVIENLLQTIPRGGGDGNAALLRDNHLNVFPLQTIPRGGGDGNGCQETPRAPHPLALQTIPRGGGDGNIVIRIARDAHRGKRFRRFPDEEGTEMCALLNLGLVLIVLQTIPRGGGDGNAQRFAGVSERLSLQTIPRGGGDGNY